MIMRKKESGWKGSEWPLAAGCLKSIHVFQGGKCHNNIIIMENQFYGQKHIVYIYYQLICICEHFGF